MEETEFCSTMDFSGPKILNYATRKNENFRWGIPRFHTITYDVDFSQNWTMYLSKRVRRKIKLDSKSNLYSFRNQSSTDLHLTSWGNSPPEVSSFSSEKKHVEKKSNYREGFEVPCLDQIKSLQVPNNHGNNQKSLNMLAISY